MASVTIKQWTVRENQSVFDLSLQLYGTPAQAVKLLLENDVAGLDEEINSGLVLVYDYQPTNFPKFFALAGYTVGNWEKAGSTTPPFIELRDADSYELREDGGLELREG